MPPAGESSVAFRNAEHDERAAEALHGNGGPLDVTDLRNPNRFECGAAFASRRPGAGAPSAAEPQLFSDS